MTLEEFERILKSLPEVENVDMTPMVGDPLLDPVLVQRLDMLEQASNVKNFDFVTNLVEADQRKLSKILDHSKLGLFVSVYGYSEQSFKMNTRRFGYQKFWNNLGTLYDHVIRCDRFRLGIYMRFFTVNEISKDTSLYWMIRCFDEACDNVTIDESTVRKNFNWGGQMEVNDPMTLPIHRSTPCLHSVEQVAILPGGDVTCCGMVDVHKRMVVGNIFEDGLDVFNKKRYDLCDKCNEYEPMEES
jgi:hypothetical protein